MAKFIDFGFILVVLSGCTLVFLAVYFQWKAYRIWKAYCKQIETLQQKLMRLELLQQQRRDRVDQLKN